MLHEFWYKEGRRFSPIRRRSKACTTLRQDASNFVLSPLETVCARQGLTPTIS